MEMIFGPNEDKNLIDSMLDDDAFYVSLQGLLSFNSDYSFCDFRMNSKMMTTQTNR